jgi:LytS/YehU family sensor histidine kinase
MVVQLSDLLRLSIDYGAEDLTSVDAELEALELYLGIQRSRYDDRLRANIEVEDGARDALVPHLILQPLVENAIVHGLSGEREALHVEVSIREASDGLRLEVRDDGAGADAERLERGQGVGLINTRARLRRLYGNRARLEIRTSPGAGFEAVLHLPERAAAEDDRA